MEVSLEQLREDLKEAVEALCECTNNTPQSHIILFQKLVVTRSYAVAYRLQRDMGCFS